MLIVVLARILTTALLSAAPPLAASQPGAAPGDAPNPEPAPSKSDAPDQPERPEIAEMRQAFSDLDDPDASVRERARVSLMGLRRRDLPAFQKLVQDSRPLAPAQAAVLKQLVLHVYLAGEPYETTGAQGFLGVRMQPTSVRIPAADGAEQTIAAVGVVIVERMPGFVGSRMLLDGDVILGLAERQDARMVDPFDFAAVIQSIDPGTTVHFQILRQGQVVRVPVTLDPKPIESEPVLLQRLVERRLEKAEGYWNRAFAGLVKEGVG